MNNLLNRIRNSEGQVEENLGEGIVSLMIKYENSKMAYKLAVKSKLPMATQEFLLDKYMQSANAYFQARNRR